MHSFSSLYHAHHSLHPEDLPFWLEMAGQFSSPILELGCGTGRVVLTLAEAGYKVVGVDYDFEMLRFLCQHIPAGLIEQVRIFQADFTRFHLAVQFSLVVMPCNTYNTLPTQARRDTLRVAKRHLLEEGIFIICQPNPILLKKMEAEGETEVDEIMTHPVTGDPVQVSSAWRRTTRHFIVDWHYDHLHADGKVERLTIQNKHYILPTKVVRQEMVQAGFNILYEYGDFDRSPYNHDSANWIILLTHYKP